MSKKFLIIIVTFMLISCEVAHKQQRPIDEPQQTKILRVVDGDTVTTIINGKSEYIRIIGIDAPEKDECFSSESTQRMRELVEEKVVILKKKPDEDRDKYNRLLRYISTEANDVGAQLVKEGYARSYPWFPHTRIETYKELERQAKENGLGLWGKCVMTKRMKLEP